MKYNTTLEQIEARFAEVTGLNEVDFKQFPINKDDYENQHQKTSKDKQKKNGFITTPIFLVDMMEDQAEAYKEGAKKIKAGKEWTDCDLCAGCGQFTVRAMRMLKNKYKVDPIKVNYLEKHHTIVELDPDNCAELVYIFGPNINLFAGDAMKLHYALEEDTGITFFNNETNEWEHNFYLDRLLKFEEVYSNRNTLHELFNNLDDKKYMSKLHKRLLKKHTK